MKRPGDAMCLLVNDVEVSSSSVQIAVSGIEPFPSQTSLFKLPWTVTTGLGFGYFKKIRH